MDSVPNPQSGRVAAAEDEVQGQSQSLHSYSGAVDPSLEAQFSQFSLDHPHVQMTQPGKLFVGGVSGTTTKVMFDEYFSQFGYMIDSVVMFDKETRNSRGFGFVTYEDKADADRVMEIQAQEVAKVIAAHKKKHPGEEIDESTIKAGHIIDEKVVEIKRAEPRPEPSKLTSNSGKWKNQKNPYQQLQNQTARRHMVGRGAGSYPRSMPYRQLQQQPVMTQFNGYHAQSGYMHPNQMYMQHYPPHMYNQGHMGHQQYYNPGAVPSSPSDIAAQGFVAHHYVPHPHQQPIYPDGSAGGYMAYSGMDGNVYYSPPPPPHKGSGDLGGEGKVPAAGSEELKGEGGKSKRGWEDRGDKTSTTATKSGAKVENEKKAESEKGAVANIS